MKPDKRKENVKGGGMKYIAAHFSFFFFVFFYTTHDSLPKRDTVCIIDVSSLAHIFGKEAHALSPT